MRVVFMGTQDFAVPTLDAVVAAGHEVILVVAQPDRPAGRGKRPRKPPVAVRALELGLPVAQPKAIRSGRFPRRYASLEPDVAVVIAYGRILTPELLQTPRLGCVNVHASLLPRWRGAAPIQAAILAGDEVTGVCTQRMEEGLDTGPIYVSRSLAIGPGETAGTLHDRLAALGAEVAVETLEGLEDRQPVSQDEAAATWVRAMTPGPGGFVGDGKARLKLREVALADGSGPPGTVLSLDPLVVACGEGAVALVEVQAPGKRPLPGRVFANGARLALGGSPWPS